LAEFIRNCGFALEPWLTSSWLTASNRNRALDPLGER
jgi:hypothetical protein